MEGVDNFCTGSAVLVSWTDEDPTLITGGTPGPPLHPC